MIVAQVALSFALLSSGALVARSFELLLRTDPGFRPRWLRFLAFMRRARLPPCPLLLRQFFRVSRGRSRRQGRPGTQEMPSETG